VALRHAGDVLFADAYVMLEHLRQKWGRSLSLSLVAVGYPTHGVMAVIKDRTGTLATIHADNNISAAKRSTVEDIRQAMALAADRERPKRH